MDGAYDHGALHPDKHAGRTPGALRIYLIYHVQQCVGPYVDGPTIAKLETVVKRLQDYPTPLDTGSPMGLHKMFSTDPWAALALESLWRAFTVEQDALCREQGARKIMQQYRDESVMLQDFAERTNAELDAALVHIQMLENVENTPPANI